MWLWMLRVLMSTLILQFDGSMRKPSDPGVSVADLARASSCAACITSSDRSTILAIGGRHLDVSSSAEAEYEGLLLGLNQLASNASVLQQYDNDEKVIIMGDCKTIIEQMRERSRSRKLRAYVEQCRAFLDEMPWEVDFRHVPREQNKLSDALCRMIVEEETRQVLEAFAAELDRWGPSEADLDALLQRFLSPGTSLVPHSRRPSLYREISKKAFRLNAQTALENLGRRLMGEISNVWRKSELASHEPEFLTRQTVKALVYQELAVNDDIAHADQVWRKHRHLQRQEWARRCAAEVRVRVTQEPYSSEHVRAILLLDQNHEDTAKESADPPMQWRDMYRQHTRSSENEPTWWFAPASTIRTRKN